MGSPYVGNRPLGMLDAQGELIQDSFDYESFLGEYSGTNLIYSGYARPGSLTSAGVCQISKQTYDGNGNVTAVQWPQVNGIASADYQFIWDNRATYTYS